MKKRLLTGLIFIVLLLSGLFIYNHLIATEDEVSYKAEDKKVVLYNSGSGKELTTIDLSAKEGDITVVLDPHDIQKAPDGQTLWLTASASQKQLSALHKNAKEHAHLMMTSDQLILVETSSNTIKQRLQMGNNIRISDIVFTTDGAYGYVSAESGNAIYKINAKKFEVEEMIQLPPESRPHFIALSEDNKKLYTKNSAGNIAYIISTENNKVTSKLSDKDTKGSINWSLH